MTKVTCLDDIDEPIEPQNLRVLRILVTVLTTVMIVGFIILVALFVIRLQSPALQSLTLPPEITLPDGARPIAFTRGPDWFAITTDDSILIYTPNGDLRQTVDIK